jgi:xylose dehydrogenase (NAD/NADP)
MINIGIIGTANIAQAFADAVKSSKNIKITAIASRNLESAVNFQHKFSIEKAFGSYQELLDDSEIEAVYIPLPNSMHKDWVVKAAVAGKHILCEKPIALNPADVAQMYEAATANRVFLMEGFPYRHQPQTQELIRRIEEGEIGKVQQIYADFGFTINDTETNIRLKPELGGGAAWDAAVYPVSVIRAITGAKPIDVFAYGEFNDQALDISLSAMLRHQNGVVAQLHCSFKAAPHRIVRVIGTEGIISCGYNNHTNPETAYIELKKGTDWNYTLQKIPVAHGNGMLFEAEYFYRSVLQFKNSQAGYAAEESIDNIATVIELLKSAKTNNSQAK